MNQSVIDSRIDPLLRICVMPGDGVGIEVMTAALPIFEHLNLPCELIFADIGWECWKSEGNTVPKATWDKIAQCDTALLGAITSKPLREAEVELPPHLRGMNHKFVSPVIQLRQKLNLYANVRPVNDLLGDGQFRFAVIRENTEGLYAGLDFAEIPEEFEPLLKRYESAGAPWQRETRADASMAVRLQTRAGLTRLFTFAFEYARSHQHDRVTLADKPNVLRHSGEFARNIFESVAEGYPEISPHIENVDAVALWMVRRPERFGVIVAENMFGDILSDLGAGVMGGLGLAPSANIGSAGSYFEPVHGSAPIYAGLNKVNPSAMFLTIAMLLDHFNYHNAAHALTTAVKHVAHSKYRTYDLGGSSTTTDVAARIIEQAVGVFEQKFNHSHDQYLMEAL